MGELNLYRLQDGETHRHLDLKELAEKWVFYTNIPRFYPSISFDDIALLTSVLEYAPLFKTAYNATGTKLGQIIEKERVGDFVCHDLDAIVAELGVKQDKRSIWKNLKGFRAKKIEGSKVYIPMMCLKEYFENFRAAMELQQGNDIPYELINQNYAVLRMFGEGEFLDYTRVMSTLDAVVKCLYDTSRRVQDELVLLPLLELKERYEAEAAAQREKEEQALHEPEEEGRKVIHFTQKKKKIPVDLEEADETQCISREEAMERVVRFRKTAYYIFMRMSGGNRADADDMYGGFCLKVLEKYHLYERRGYKFEVWLNRVARNHAFNYSRNRYRETPIDTDYDMEELDKNTIKHDEFRNPEERLSGVELDRTIKEAYKQLPEEWRQTIQLRQNGLAYAEIADTLGCPVGTVMSRLNRARHRIAEYMTQKGLGIEAETYYNVQANSDLSEPSLSEDQQLQLPPD